MHTDARLFEIWKLARSVSEQPPAPGATDDIPPDVDGVLDQVLAWLRLGDARLQRLQTFFDRGLDGFFFMMLDEPLDWNPHAPDEEKEMLLDLVFRHEHLTHANDAMLEQYGAERSEFIGMTPNELFAHDIVQGRREWRALFDAGVLETLTREKRLDGREISIQGSYVTLYDKAGRTVGHFGTQRDVTKVVDADRALRASTLRLAEAQRVAHVGMWDWNVRTNDLQWSEEVYRILGTSHGDGTVDYSDFLAAVHPEDVAAVEAAVAAALAGSPYSIEHRMLRRDDTIRWVHERGVVTFDAEGAPVRMLGTVQDITDRKLAEQELEASLREKEVLLREIHHRVKNNLQIIKSLLYLQLVEVQDPAAVSVLRESIDRIQVMALLHERLYCSDNLGSISLPDFLKSLVDSLFDTYVRSDQGITFDVQADDQTLDVDRAIPLGLLLTEVVSNAIKHAFPTGGGHVSVSGTAVPGGTYSLVMNDDGIGLPDGLDVSQAASLGMRLIHSLAKQLGAQLSITSDGGTRFEVLLPKQQGEP